MIFIANNDPDYVDVSWQKLFKIKISYTCVVIILLFVGLQLKQWQRENYLSKENFLI